MLRYKSKNLEKSEYKTAVGTTDYNIPMFGYRSAFLIFTSEIIVILITLAVCHGLNVDSNLPILIFGSITFGLTIGYSQFFLERKRGFTTGFFLTVIAFTLLTGVLFYLVLFKGAFI